MSTKPENPKSNAPVEEGLSLQKTPSKTPKLRFPEFRDEWVEKKLGDVGIYKVGGDIQKLNFSKTKDKLFKYPIFANGSEEGIYGYADNFQYTPPAVTISGRGNLGKAKSRYENFNAIVRLIILKPYENNNSKFLEEIINMIDFAVESTGVPQLTAPQIKSYKINTPSLPEQTKIAEFLTAVDDKIELLDKQKNLLERYKKGLMQRLFPSDRNDTGGVQPRLRFRDENGNNFPDWEEKKLGELCLLITKGTTPTYFEKQGINYIKTECFTDIGIDAKKCLFISKDFHNGIGKRSSLQENDILFAIAGSIGKVRIVDKNILPANTNQALCIIRLKNDTNIKFLYSILNSSIMTKYIIENITIGAQPNLNLDQINNFKLHTPPLSEQNKIADFLTSLDNRIELVDNQIKSTQKYKKSLLQKMFV